MNLLAETRKIIEDTDHTPDDIVYIGNRQGESCSWDEFITIADVDYDPGYGRNYIRLDVYIVFSDGTFIEREEYDGAECWRYVAITVENIKKLTTMKEKV